MKTIYYVDLNENELVHWKYIKRVKLRNGKWRYIYDDSSLEKYNQQGDAALGRSFNAAARANRLYSDYQDLARNRSYSRNDKISMARTQRELTRTQKVQNHYVERANRSYKRYRTKRITSFPARTISKGIVTVMNWLNR